MWEMNWLGSFQNTRLHYSSENPLEDVWAQLGRVATREHLTALKPNNPSVPWDEFCKYIQVRFMQAQEFRNAARAGTVLTSPLTLYYSFLNLMRGTMAMVPEVMPINSHGLKFIAGADILSSAAELCRGTFTQHLELVGVTWKKQDRITLGDALGCIVEMVGDLAGFDPKLCHVQFVSVIARMRGALSLGFQFYRRDFAANWAKDFPTLATSCEPAADCVLTLNVKPDAYSNQPEGIAEFLHKNLWNALTITQRPKWWTLRRSEPHLQLDRISYYHVAMFILGSAVRYQPELVSEIASSNSGVGWLIKRFLQRAERFYPQLQLTYTWGGQQVYF
jgi:hypothetical protein